MSEFAEGLAVGMNENRGYGNGGFGNGFGDGWWILLLLLCGWGNNGWGNNGNNQNIGYELGKMATTNDVAAGFNNSAVLNKLNDITLGQSQGFAGVQQTLCQGFSGVNQTVMNGFHGVDNAICTLGYNTQAGFNSLSREIGDCCCTTQRSIDAVKYENAKNTCDIQNSIANSTRDIIDSQRCGTDRIIAHLTNQEMDRLRAENQGLRFQASQAAQNAYLVDTLRPTARPAYITCSPYESAFGYGRNGCGCGCGC
jgi:hypothetical protein